MWTFIAICTVFFDEKTKHTGKSAIKDPHMQNIKQFTVKTTDLIYNKTCVFAITQQ